MLLFPWQYSPVKHANQQQQGQFQHQPPMPPFSELAIHYKHH